jgi:hypothetical protein
VKSSTPVLSPQEMLATSLRDFLRAQQDFGLDPQLSCEAVLKFLERYLRNSDGFRENLRLHVYQFPLPERGEAKA